MRYAIECQHDNVAAIMAGLSAQNLAHNRTKPDDRRGWCVHGERHCAAPAHGTPVTYR
jgi:hypothetical protein